MVLVGLRRRRCEYSCSLSSPGSTHTLRSRAGRSGYPTIPGSANVTGIRAPAKAYGLIGRTREHPLLGWRLKDAAAAWENSLDPESFPWLADHKVGDAIVLPGAAFAELALAASRAHFGGPLQ